MPEVHSIEVVPKTPTLSTTNRRGHPRKNYVFDSRRGLELESFYLT